MNTTTLIILLLIIQAQMGLLLYMIISDYKSFLKFKTDCYKTFGTILKMINDLNKQSYLTKEDL